ncbi:MAG: hypothetical protein LRZ97_00575 [Candidatus Pacebacteria bacterium]|nr:hypothetical protein [Candidatus Paceibacterota bacterium]
MNKGFTFVVGFIVGIVTIYVWGQIFSDKPVTIVNEDAQEVMNIDAGGETNVDAEDDSVVVVGEDAITTEGIILTPQIADELVNISSIYMSKDGWIVIHEIKDGVIANALGAARRDAGKHEDVVVHLLRNTVSGGEYAVVLYEDDGDKQFNLASDIPVVDEQGGFIMSKFSIK